VVPHGLLQNLVVSGGIPSSCDILATHLPPFKTLDRTYSGKIVGSAFLSEIQLIALTD
jgi:Icc-related predicted phosphoesterase